MRILLLVLIATGLWGCAGTRVQPAKSVLIFGSDADLQSVSRNDEIFRELEFGMSGPINGAGYEVLTEEDLIPYRGAASGIRRSDTRTMALVRSLDEPTARFAALCSLYANAKRRSFETRLRLKLDVILIDTADGSQIDDFEVTGSDDWSVSSDCTGSCLQGALAERAQELAESAGERVVLSVSRRGKRVAGRQRKDEAAGQDRSVELHFLGFAQPEIYAVEDQLQTFDAFRDLRLKYSSKYRVTFAYDTALSVARLKRRLERMLATQGLDTRITVEDERIDVQRVGVKIGAR